MKTWAEAWGNFERVNKIPDRIRHLKILDWNIFEDIVIHGLFDLAGYVSNGDALLLKGAFSKEFIDGMRTKTIAWVQRCTLTCGRIPSPGRF